MITNIIMIGIIVAAIILSNIWEPIAWIAIIIAVVYLIEAAHSSTNKFLWNAMRNKDASNYINIVKTATPTVTFHIECWHMEKRTRTVESKDSDGRTHTKTEDYEVKVVSHREQENFHFTRCEDITGNIQVKGKELCMRLSLSKSYILADDQTR